MEDKFVEKFEYFVKRTEMDLAEIKEKVGKLWEFRISIIGVSIAASTIASIAVSIAYIYFGVKI
jgi:hypothetical protein